MKGFLKELQESNAAGAVQVGKSSFSVKQPDLDAFADKEIFSVHGKGKLLWAEVYEEFNNLPAQSGTQMKVMLLIDGRVQANTRMNFYSSVSRMVLQVAPPEQFVHNGNYSFLPTRLYGLLQVRDTYTFSCSEQERTGGSSAENGFYFPIAAFIPFKESVEIRVSNTFVKAGNTYGNFRCGVGYLLDED